MVDDRVYRVGQKGEGKGHIMGRAAIIDLSAIDEALKNMEETVAKLRAIVDRAHRGVPLRYEEENGVKENRDEN
jgi:hypothetical protein